jgi:hypothetical protein
MKKRRNKDRNNHQMNKKRRGRENGIWLEKTRTYKYKETIKERKQ